MGLSLRGKRLLASAIPVIFYFRFSFFLAGFSASNFSAMADSVLSSTTFSPSDFFTENSFGRGGDNFFGGNHFAANSAGTGSTGIFGFEQNQFFGHFARLKSPAPVCCRSRSAHGRFRHGQSVRAEAAGGFPGFSGQPS